MERKATKPTFSRIEHGDGTEQISVKAAVEAINARMSRIGPALAKKFGIPFSQVLEVAEQAEDAVRQAANQRSH